tara:strand:+ start:276 stop:533 length:258 start_codon:yes stop_codon:yes gene_type:complete
MPIYEYSCDECFELTSIFFKTLSDTKKPSCASCGGGAVKRVISNIAILHSSQDLYRQYDSMARYRDSIDEKDPFDGKGDYLADNL